MSLRGRLDMKSKLSTSVLFAAALALVGSVQPASADLITVDFTVHGPFSCGVCNPGQTPFGMSLTTDISGVIVFDSTKTGASAYNSINYTTGTYSWEPSDLQGGAVGVSFAGDTVTSFVMDFDDVGSANWVQYNSTHFQYDVAIQDSLGNGVACSGCVSVTSQSVTVPGPIAGAGLPGPIFAGGGLLGWWRRRQKIA